MFEFLSTTHNRFRVIELLEFMRPYATIPKQDRNTPIVRIYEQGALTNHVNVSTLTVYAYASHDSYNI
jgi:hypothetical protein